MIASEHLSNIVASLQPVVAGVADDDLGDSSPCSDWDVRTVANHLLGTVEAMRRIGAGEPLDPEDPWGTGGDHVRSQWRDDLSALLTAYADAWSRPEAWEGVAADVSMPREIVGEMSYVEVMLHGWDLAKGSGQDIAYADADVDQALAVMSKIGEMGRQQGAFGAEVEVPAAAPTLDHVLAQAGRDPEWQQR